MSRLRSAKRLLVDLPRQLRLAYCLMRDHRVPRYTKAAFGAAEPEPGREKEGEEAEQTLPELVDGQHATLIQPRVQAKQIEEQVDALKVGAE